MFSKVKRRFAFGGEGYNRVVSEIEKHYELALSRLEREITESVKARERYFRKIDLLSFYESMRDDVFTTSVVFICQYTETGYLSVTCDLEEPAKESCEWTQLCDLLFEYISESGLVRHYKVAGGVRFMSAIPIKWLELLFPPNYPQWLKEKTAPKRRIRLA